MKKISILIIILLIANIFFIKNRFPKVIPFKNSHNEDIRIPIIQKDINNKEVLFILDSGANISIIDSTWYYNNRQVFTETEDVNMVLIGISGIVSINSKIVYTEIDEDYVVFAITDLVPVTQNLSKQGFKIVGILGSDYLMDNNLIIDYKKQAVYTAY
jgi:hypothetical protein